MASPWAKEVSGPTRIWVDNKAVIAASSNTGISGRTKHMDVRCRFVQDYHAKRIIRLDYVRSSQNLADLFTKPLPEGQFLELRASLNMV